MKIMSALVIAASLFGSSWQPPQKVLDAQFWMNVPETDDPADVDVRPVFLNPRHLEKACAQFFSGEVTYQPLKEGTFDLLCKLPIRADVPHNEVYFHFIWADDNTGLSLLAVYQARTGQTRVRVGGLETASIVNSLRDQLLEAGAITKPPEGRDAFSPTFRWCKDPTDRDCTPED